MTDVSRRVLIGAAVGALAAGALPARARSSQRFFGESRPIGLQLFAVQDLLVEHLDATLRQIARMGFRRVEANRGALPGTPAALRQALDKAGLLCSSVHVPLQPIPGLSGPTLGANLSEAMDDARVLGARYVTIPVPGVPERLAARDGESLPAFFGRATQAMTRADWQEMADTLNRIGAQLAATGLRLGYHNHNIELAPLGSATILDFLLANTDPGTVMFEMDIAWVTAAGLDPIALLDAHPKRFRLMHIKELAKTSTPDGEGFDLSREIGAVRTNWRQILDAAARAGVEEYFVELEPPFKALPLVSLESSYRHLAAL